MTEVQGILVTQEKWDELEMQVAVYRGFALTEWYSSKETASFLDIDQSLLQDLMAEGRAHFKVLNGDHAFHSGYWIAEVMLTGMHYTCIGLRRKYLSPGQYVVDGIPPSPEMERRIKAREPSKAEYRMVIERIMKEAQASGIKLEGMSEEEARKLGARLLLEDMERLNINIPQKNRESLERTIRGEKEEPEPAYLVPEPLAPLFRRSIEPEPPTVQAEKFNGIVDADFEPVMDFTLEEEEEDRRFAPPAPERPERGKRKFGVRYS
jgi:hypothetical protein